MRSQNTRAKGRKSDSGYISGVHDGDSKVKFMSDSKTHFSKQIGWMAGVGDRNARYAIVIEKDGTISYAEVEKSPREVSVSYPQLHLYELYH